MENKKVFYFKNTIEGIKLNEKKKSIMGKRNICGFCEKEIIVKNVRDQCQLTGKNKSPVHQICNINVKQKQSNFITFIFHNFNKYDCDQFLKSQLIKKE